MINTNDFFTHFQPGSPIFRKLARHIRWCGDAVEDLRFTSFSWAKFNENHTALHFYNRYGAAVATLNLNDFVTKDYMMGYATQNTVNDLSTQVTQNVQQLNFKLDNAKNEISSLSASSEDFNQRLSAAESSISAISASLNELNAQMQLSVQSIDARLQAVESRLTSL